LSYQLKYNLNDVNHNIPTRSRANVIHRFLLRKDVSHASQGFGHVHFKGSDGDREIKSEHLIESINFFLRRKKLERAAIIAEKSGYLTHASDYYARKGWFVSAARVELKLGHVDRAIEFYKKEEFDGAIGRLIEKEVLSRGIVGDPKENKFLKEVLERYEKAKLWGRAAKLAERFGLDEEAIGYYEKRGWFASAGKLSEKLGKVDNAIDYYLKEATGNAPLAIRGDAVIYNVYPRYGNYHVYYFDKAAKLAKRTGNEERSADIYETGVKFFETRENYSAAAKLLKKAGKIDDAISMYMKRGTKQDWVVIMDYDFPNFYPNRLVSAARLAERSGNLSRAMSIYEKYMEEIEHVQLDILDFDDLKSVHKPDYVRKQLQRVQKRFLKSSENKQLNLF
jgi:tetratricopeptide (TPR) repeat protein